MRKPKKITDNEAYGDERCINAVSVRYNMANESFIRALFVEGPDDIKLYGPHISYLYGPGIKICCNDSGVLEAFRKSFVLSSERHWQPAEDPVVAKKWVETQLCDKNFKLDKWVCRGAVDKDFDSASALETKFEGLGVTDTHDSEMLVFSCIQRDAQQMPCFCVRGVFQQDKVSMALRLSFELGLIKWISTFLHESHYQGFFHNDRAKNERFLAAIKQVLITTEDKKIPDLIDDVYASLIGDGHISIENVFSRYAFSLAQEENRVSSTAHSNKCLEEFFGESSSCREYASRACVQKISSCLSSDNLFSGVWMDSKGNWLTDEITFENALEGTDCRVFDVCNGHDFERFLQVEFHNSLLDLSGSLKDLALENLEEKGKNTPLFNTHLFKKITDKW
jgi:hypothetical protein